MRQSVLLSCALVWSFANCDWSVAQQPSAIPTDLFRKRLHDYFGARNTAAHYSDVGDGNRIFGNLDGAIAAYNRAIELNSNYAPAYDGRGKAKMTKGDLDGAIDDYNHAIELNSKDADAYYDRGNAKMNKGDLDGAIGDYNRVIELNSKDADAYYIRSFAKRDKGDLDGAIADCNRVIELNSTAAHAYRARACLFFEKQNWNGALSDFRRGCELDARHQDYPRLDIWLIRSRLGESVAANAELDESVGKGWNAAPGDWASTIARYLLDKLSEADLFAAAKSPDAKKECGQLCEAWFYAGMKTLFAGDQAAAAEYFNKCLATEQKHFVEYQFARAELKALGK
jgi:lipoprotein NlpI